MRSKQPPATPSATAQRSNRPASSKSARPAARLALPAPGNRWQRSKRYGWDSR